MTGTDLANKSDTLRFARARKDEPLRVLIVTDAWTPQVNGVVTTLKKLDEELVNLGHEVRYVTPDMFHTIPCPTYPEIRLAWRPGPKIRDIIMEFCPHAIHIATEGPLGLSARRLCIKYGMDFSTSFHTRFPEYIHARIRLPIRWTYAWLRWFHARAQITMVTTPNLRRELEAKGFTHLSLLSRGVDVELFKPRQQILSSDCVGLPRPIWLYVGRVAVEKNIEAFLKLELEGTKMVVGDGPMLKELREKYPDVHFTGPRFGEELAVTYAASDVFVFPSRTDTFGLVLLEALASGVPVAAYPVPGPLDVIGDAPVGVLDENLGRAAQVALDIPAERCRAFALNYSWQTVAEQFASHLAITWEKSEQVIAKEEASILEVISVD